MTVDKKYPYLIFVLFLFLFTFPNAFGGGTTMYNNPKITKNTLGLEFWGRIIRQRTFTKNNIVFEGRGDQPLSETQKANINIDIEEPLYDVGIFYRLKRLKIGWIPIILDEHYSKDIVYYHQSFGEWPLGGHDVNIKIYNIAYFEVYGLHAKNTYANLALRIDYTKVSGEFVTYKYPFGDEWHQKKIIINRERVYEKFYILSIGPKIDYDFKTIIQSDTPLKYIGGVDIMVMYDIPIGYRNVKGYSILASLVLEF